MQTLTIGHLQLAPLGAGDLIDRTVRLYRRHFMALIRASAPPIVLTTTGTVMWAIGARAMGLADTEGLLAAYFLLAAFGVLLWAVGSLSQLLVMGGASRNLVMHLLHGEPVTARAIYRSVRSRFWGLLGATVCVVVCLLFAGGLAIFGWYLVVLLVALSGVLVVQQGIPFWFALALGIIAGLIATLGALYLFFLVAGRVAYVPQVMMVEGEGVFAAFGRSSRLARGHVRRLIAMFLFTIFATDAALMLLLIPLGWIGYLNGVDPFALSYSKWPVWYSVGYGVVRQLSTILLAPVWMLGLSLLYTDQRVRHEAYDVELLTVQRFGDMPALPFGSSTPLVPAIAAQAQKASPPPAPPARETEASAGAQGAEPAPRRSSNSTLGIFD
jgi:hypothetical protein